jgi:RNA polymerase sigma factor (sigma-70 family)
MAVETTLTIPEARFRSGPHPPARPRWPALARILLTMDDGALLHAWREGDRAAGEELFERHYATVERFFRNKVAEPNELIQQTFVACVEAKTRFRGDSKFRTFLLGIAINVLRTHYRQVKRQRGLSDLDERSVVDLGQTPSRILHVRDEERLLLEALRRLPLELQLVLELRYWDELKHEELAELLEVPRSTINTRLRRGRELLEHNLQELAASPQLLHSTVTRLDDWVEQQRQRSPLARHDREPSS